MSIIDFVIGLFQSNKPAIELDLFAQAKLALAEEISLKFKRSIHLYAGDTPDIPTRSASEYALKHVFSLTESGVDAVFNLECELKERMDGSKNKIREMQQYHNPCIDYFRNDLAPWIMNYADCLNHPLKACEIPVGEVEEIEPEITGDRHFFLIAQKKQIVNILSCYLPLVQLLPEDIATEYLLEDARNMVKEGQIIALKNILQNPPGRNHEAQTSHTRPGNYLEM